MKKDILIKINLRKF